MDIKDITEEKVVSAIDVISMVDPDFQIFDFTTAVALSLGLSEGEYKEIDRKVSKQLYEEAGVSVNLTDRTYTTSSGVEGKFSDCADVNDIINDVIIEVYEPSVIAKRIISEVYKALPTE